MHAQRLTLSLKDQLGTVYKCAANDSAFDCHTCSNSQDPLTAASLVLASHLLSCFEPSELTPSNDNRYHHECACKETSCHYSSLYLNQATEMIHVGSYQWYHYKCAFIKMPPIRCKCFLYLKRQIIVTVS